MSAAVIMLAIVVLWAVVLVPLWLRRDGTDGVLVESEFQASDDHSEDLPEEIPEDVPARVAQGAADVEEPAAPQDDAPAPPRRDRAPNRPAWRPSARVIARRRRRMLWCTLLVLITAGLATGGLIPGWGALPAPVLFVGYLSVLRAAVRADAERRDAYLRHRAEQGRRRERDRQRVESERRREHDLAEERKAKVIRLEAHLPDQPYDQYADARLRAVGD